MSLTTSTSILQGAFNPTDNEAWTRFIAFYKDLLPRYVSARIRKLGLGWTPARMEEVVCDLITHLCLKVMPRYSLEQRAAKRARFRTYLCAVTRNFIADQDPDRKRKKREREDEEARNRGEAPRPSGDSSGSRPRVFGEGQVDLTTVADDAGDPDELWDQEFKMALLRAVYAEVRAEVLPKNANKWRSFEMCALQGRPAAEVAAELGIAVNLVYQNSKRVSDEVIRRTREEYDKEMGE